MEKIKTKYPRTYHLPFSEGLQNDDRKVERGWESILENEVVLTEKLDGENNSMDKYAVYARSHGAPTENPWTRNLWEHGGLHDQIKSWLDDECMIYGENLYGIHSIEYDKLPTYFHMFAYREKDVWKSWDEVEEMANILAIPTVPVLYRGIIKNTQELEEMVLDFMGKGSKYGNTIEGVVLRNVNEFHMNDFSMNVMKYVRKNHVQTDQFWQKNWKKATIDYGRIF